MIIMGDSLSPFIFVDNFYFIEKATVISGCPVIELIGEF